MATYGGGLKVQAAAFSTTSNYTPASTGQYALIQFTAAGAGNLLLAGTLIASFTAAGTLTGLCVGPSQALTWTTGAGSTVSGTIFTN